jgi:type I restriction enzyme, R subunit
LWPLRRAPASNLAVEFMQPFSESIVEDAALSWLGALQYSTEPGPEIIPGELSPERTSLSEVVLPERLRTALRKLNTALPAEALAEAFRKVTVPQHPSLIANNRAFHRMLVDGIAVECRRKDGSIGAEIVRLIDFNDSEANDWLAVNQFTVIEDQHKRRPDIVIFVNGLPLGIIELKNAADEDADIWTAFNQFQTYQQQIPSLFVHNAVLVISDGLEARLGPIRADMERFMPWRTIEGETLAPRLMTQLEVLLRGVFDKRHFLDLIHYFVVFEDDGGSSVIKKIGGYHQFHAVRRSFTMTVAPSWGSAAFVALSTASGISWRSDSRIRCPAMAGVAPFAICRLTALPLFCAMTASIVSRLGKPRSNSRAQAIRRPKAGCRSRRCRFRMNTIR